MRRLNKEQLLGKVQRAFRQSGLRWARLSEVGDHPAHYDVYGEQAWRLRVYIWNVSHGGHGRPRDEYRIQVTGVDRIEAGDGAQTVILGWSGPYGVLAAWDPQRHHGEVSSSPSKQVKEASLNRASNEGFALCERGGNEITVAFRPEFFRTYLADLETLHGAGPAPDWAEEVTQSVEEAAEKHERLPPEPDPASSSPRERTLSRVMKSVRDSSFRKRVVLAYSYACTVCGMQLDLVEAAHIVPVRHRASTDETKNGLCLCSLHHKAMDESLIRIRCDYRVELNGVQLDDLRRMDRLRGLEAFRDRLRHRIALPAEQEQRPDPEYLAIRASLAG